MAESAGRIEDYFSENPCMVEKLLTIVLQSSEQGIAVIDHQGRIIRHNQHWAKQFRTSGKTLGMSVGELWPDLELLDEQTVIYKAPAFSTRWKISCRRLDSEHKILFVNQDDTAAAAVSHQRELLAQKELFEAILNHIDEAIFVMDVQGHIVYLNQAAEKLEGYSTREVANKHIREVCVASDWRYSKLLEAIETGKQMVNINCIYPTAKKLLNIIASNYPIYTDDKLVGGVCIYQDIEAYRESVQKKSNTWEI